jgi:hypothetical protein
MSARGTKSLPFDFGKSSIILSPIQCSGTEQHISDCYYRISTQFATSGILNGVVCGKSIFDTILAFIERKHYTHEIVTKFLGHN